jgi:PadR family transcriptional regulator PadR
MATDRVKGHLDLMLLGVLNEGPGHGYAVITALRERSGGTFDLPEGTVYPALHRLQDAGLLSSTWEDVGGRRRRMYRLTAKGVRALVAEQSQWTQFASAVDQVLRPLASRPPSLATA